MDPAFVRFVEVSVTLLAVLFSAAAIVSAAYIVWVYRHRNVTPDQRVGELFLTRNVVRDVRVAVCATIILGYLALALAGYGLGRPWGAIVIGIPVIVLLYGPTGDALLWRKERRK